MNQEINLRARVVGEGKGSGLYHIKRFRLAGAEPISFICLASFFFFLGMSPLVCLNFLCEIWLAKKIPHSPLPQPLSPMAEIAVAVATGMAK